MKLVITLSDSNDWRRRGAHIIDVLVREYPGTNIRVKPGPADLIELSERNPRLYNRVVELMNAHD